MTQRLREQHCLDCGAAVSAATPVDGESTVAPGAVSICAYCAAIAVYGDDLILRRATADEWAEIVDMPEVSTARTLIFAARAERQ